MGYAPLLLDALLAALPKHLPVKARQTGTKSIMALGYNQALDDVEKALRGYFDE